MLVWNYGLWCISCTVARNACSLQRVKLVCSSPELQTAVPEQLGLVMQEHVVTCLGIALRELT